MQPPASADEDFELACVLSLSLAEVPEVAGASPTNAATSAPLPAAAEGADGEGPVPISGAIAATSAALPRGIGSGVNYVPQRRELKVG